MKSGVDDFYANKFVDVCRYMGSLKWFMNLIALIFVVLFWIINAVAVDELITVIGHCYVLRFIFDPIACLKHF